MFTQLQVSQVGSLGYQE